MQPPLTSAARFTTTTSWNVSSSATLQCWVGALLASRGPLLLAWDSPSSTPEPNRELRLAGVLPAAGRGLAGWTSLSPGDGGPAPPLP